MRLLFCIGRAVARKGLKMLADAVPFGGTLLEIAEEAWKEYRKEPAAPALQAEVQQVASAPPLSLKQTIQDIVLEVAPSEPPEVRQALADYLTQVPSAIRRSLSRPSDPRGHSVPGTLRLQRAEDLLAFLPARRPRFCPGDQPLAGTSWVLEELLGTGGFGEVWKAHDPDFQGLVVALKFCLDPEASRAVLVHEAANLDRIMRHGRHPGIVQLRAVHRKSEPICLEYEYIEGGDLAGLILEKKEQGGIQPEEAARWMLHLAGALQFAHQLQPPLVHRDLKPANILVSRDGARGSCRLWIADFGIGDMAARQAIGETRRGATSRGEVLATTLRGSYTPLYASPQQIEGQPPDPRDDIHALGVIWYQMLSGDVSRGRPSGSSWRKQLAARGMAGPLLHLLDQCLDDDPAVRPADAGAFCAVLEKALRPAMPSGGTRSPALLKPASGPLTSPGPGTAQQGTLRLVRDARWMGVLVAFSVFVDGQPAGQLKVNETLTVPVPAGPHKVKVSGGGTFFGIEQDVIVQPNQVHSWKVGYTWMGGIRLIPA
jgi:serine/threonine protein kinase